MALAKVFTDEKGISTSYHKIREATLTADRLYCSLESYVSKDYRDANKPAGFKSFTFDVTLEEEESMGIRALCYTKIKALSTWEDATDC